MGKKIFLRTLSQRYRNVFVIIQYVLSFLRSLLAIILFGISCYILFYVTSKAHLLGESFSFRPFGLIYIFVSAFICLQELALVFVLYYSRKIENLKNLIGKGWMDVLVYSLVFSTLIVLPAILIYSFWFVSGVSVGFLEGMRGNLRKYGSKRDETVVFNRLQFDYQCCGAEHFEDWKDVENFGDYDIKGVLKLKSVPFSCCKIETLSFCDNHLQNGNYSTINRNGCAHLFNRFIEMRIYSAIVVWVLILFLLVLSLLSFQYWKTSLVSAFKNNDPKGRGEGWLYLPFIGKDLELVPVTSSTQGKRQSAEEKQPLIPESINSSAEDFPKLKKEETDQSIALLADIPDPPNKSGHMPNELEISPRYSLSAPELPKLMTKKCIICGGHTLSTGSHLCLGEQHNPSMSMTGDMISLIATSDYNRSDSVDRDSSSDIFGTKYQRNYQKKPNDKQTSGQTNTTEVKIPIDFNSPPKLDSKSNTGMTRSKDNPTQPDPTQRKLRERYFILKEIR